MLAPVATSDQRDRDRIVAILHALDADPYRAAARPARDFAPGCGWAAGG
jgi:hypothetical protein